MVTLFRVCYRFRHPFLVKQSLCHRSSLVMLTLSKKWRILESSKVL